MTELLKLMGFDYEVWKATDGQRLHTEPLYKEVKFLPGYEDPFYKRPMKKGEVCHCFINVFVLRGLSAFVMIAVGNKKRLRLPL